MRSFASITVILALVGFASADWLSESPMLCQASWAGDLQLLEKHIAAGDDVNEQDAQGRTALMLAAYTGVEGRNGERIPSTKLVEALLAAGADVLIEAGDQNTALHEGPPPKPPVSLFLSPAASACTRVRPR